MRILAIESTCDETAAAVVESCGAGARVLSSVVASSVTMYQKYGGIVPEVAAREQVMSVIPVITEALVEHKNDIDAIAVSYGPGLMGSLLIGVETAKALSWAWNKPLLKVNHMTGHVLANWIVKDETVVPEFPCVALVVSGGHTDLILLENFQDWKWIGGTRDDAVGEAFDKTARILGFPYPGGPNIDKAAQRVDEKSWREISKEMRLPRPMINDDSLEMSFSGIKAAMARIVEGKYFSRWIPPGIPSTFADQVGNDKDNGEIKRDLMAKEFSEAVIEVLLKKTLLAIERFAPKSVILAGGVAANSSLRERLKTEVEKSGNTRFFVPDLKYCGDNGAMIGAAAILRPENSELDLRPDPSLGVA